MPTPTHSKIFFLCTFISAVFLASGVAVAQSSSKGPSEEEMLKQLTTPRKSRSLGVAPVAGPRVTGSTVVAPAAEPVAAPAVIAPQAVPSPAALPPAPSSVPMPVPLPAQVPTPVAVVIEPPEPRPSIDLDIRFDFNSATIRPESREPLERLAKVMKNPALLDAKFAIEGHTDGKGKTDYNLKLSEQRAQAVKTMLSRQGIAPDRLNSLGKGSSEPANPSDLNAAENRRVRIVNLN